MLKHTQVNVFVRRQKCPKAKGAEEERRTRQGCESEHFLVLQTIFSTVKSLLNRSSCVPLHKAAKEKEKADKQQARKDEQKRKSEASIKKTPVGLDAIKAAEREAEEQLAADAARRRVTTLDDIQFLGGCLFILFLKWQHSANNSFLFCAYQNDRS